MGFLIRGAGLAVILAFAWPGGVYAQTYSRTETIEYHNDASLWVMGQVKKVMCVSSVPAHAACDGGTDSLMSETSYGWKALPWKTYAFGKLQQTLTYDTTSAVATGQRGTLKTVTDGNNNTIMLGQWQRGIPQSIQYPATPDQPSGTSQSALVNHHGWIDWVTDENGYKTCYTYDPMGRLASLTHPSETQAGECNTSTWAATLQTFAPATTAKYGIPAGHWQQTVSTSNARKVTYFDALWRPLVEEAFDNTNTATANATRSVSVKRYDTSGRPAFQSYPLRTLTNYATVTQGTRSFYDALDRPTRVEQDSELGVLATTTDYLPGFKTRVTSPKHQGTGIFTETSYLAWDQPTTDFPLVITHPESAVTTITRDAFGKPLGLLRTGGGAWKQHYFAYDAHQRLCKRTDVETGTNAMGYDNAGNLIWSASGLSWSPTGACLDPQAVQVDARRVDRLYDARNRLKELSFPDGRGDQSWEYTPDGLPQKVHTVNAVGANNIDNAYLYNSRRLLEAETQLLPTWYTYRLDYGYDKNGHLSTLQYPSGRTVGFAPNPLGQATHVKDLGTGGATYASQIAYYPNGSIEKFNYGNGILHEMLQNPRQLPSWVAFNNSVGRYQYGYDKNGNVTSLIDYTIGQNGRTTRTMTYDGLDRLLRVDSPLYASSPVGYARYFYDTLDNLTKVFAPGRDHAYCYDAHNQLTNIKANNCTTGATVSGLGYNVQGNLSNRDGQLYDFDYGNRLREVTGVERYRYDASGRRILAMSFSDGTILSQYGQSGQLLYQKNERSGQMKEIDHIYLAGSVIAQREVPIGGGAVTHRFLHTDVLGSPVAATNGVGTVVERMEYEPYGQQMVSTATIGQDRPGYTGHVLDAATGLNYMQQRYYDPAIGRFLSVDPVTADANTGGNFNRYKYAGNNPYKFTDPDGRAESPAWMRAMIPGQVTWDHAVTSAENGNYGQAAVQAGVAFAEAGMAAVTLGASHAETTAARAVATTATTQVSALARAKEIQGALKPATQNRVTTAVAETQEGVRVVASSEGSLRPAQRAVMQPGEVAAKGVRGTHAEVNAVNGARAQGLTPTSVSPSRPACTNCQEAMKKLDIPIRDR